MMKIYCDGGSRGNPGPAASAFVAVDENGKVIHEDSLFLGETTNNIAEYTAVIIALKWLSAASIKEDKIEIVLDSELVQKQMTGEYKIKNPGLLLKAQEAKALEQSLSTKISYSHTLRGGNAHADRLVNKALDLYTT